MTIRGQAGRTCRSQRLIGATLTSCHELTGGQGVAGSNPVIPTVKEQVRGPVRFGGAALELSWLPKWLPKYALDEHGRSSNSCGLRLGCAMPSVQSGQDGRYARFGVLGLRGGGVRRGVGPWPV